MKLTITNMVFEHKSSPSSRWMTFSVSGKYSGHTFIQAETVWMSDMALHDIDLVCETMKNRLRSRVTIAVEEAIKNGSL